VNLSVVIPAYNEADNIKNSLEELLKVIGGIPDIGDVKVVVVDDHSSDNTFNVISQMNDLRVQCLRLSRRSGSHVAIRAGLVEAVGDTVLCISADGQDDPVVLEEMIEKWRRGAKTVWALRKDRENESWYYRKASNMFYFLVHILGGDRGNVIDQSRADFFLLDRAVVSAINSCVEVNFHLFGILGWLGFAQDTVEYNRRDRRYGKSKWSVRKKVFMAKEWITAFTGMPLKLMTFIGFCFAFSGFLYAVYLMIFYFTENPAPGWSSIMVAILVIGGVQMIMLGIIGEYLWRNLEEVRRRPLYFIEKKTRTSK
jgi:dolichol-phosphate mannosyltransferase